MNNFDTAANLALLLTEKTGSCNGTLKLVNQKPDEQLQLFGTVLTRLRRNVFIINGAEQTVTTKAWRSVFGKNSARPEAVTPFRDLGD